MSIINEVDYMTSSYKILYEIESTLSYIINSALSKKYGMEWELILKVNRRFETLRYYEIIGYFSKYPPLTNYFTKSQLKRLYQLADVRNKIAHMKIISDIEYELLIQVQKLVGSKFENILNNRCNRNEKS